MNMKIKSKLDTHKIIGIILITTFSIIVLGSSIYGKTEKQYVDLLTDNYESYSTIMKQLSSSENAILDLETKIVVQNEELDKLRVQMVATKKSLRDAENVLESERDDFKKIAVETYTDSEVSPLELVISSDDVVSHDNNAEYYATASELKNDQVIKYNDAVKEVKAKEESLAADQSREEELMKSMENDLNTVKSQKAELDIQKGAVEKEREKILDDIDEEDKDISRIAAKVSSSNGFVYTAQLSGKYLWPTGSVREISSFYGTRNHPVLGVTRMHRGVDIAMPTGTPVYSTENGIIKFVGEESGFGKYVVVDHGGGIQSLYGHNSKIVVMEGQIVTKGTKIAEVGSTGRSTGPHCHFQVSLNGDIYNGTVDPLSLFGFDV